jgi:hypothetical protein
VSAPILPPGIPRPTGTGALQVQATDGGVAGGIARGANAVDLQMVRFQNNHVASGQNAVLAGGSSNISSGTNAVVSGGVINTASGTSSWVPGGVQGSTRGTAGRGAWAAGTFGTQGDAQAGEFVLRKQTTDATLSRLTFDAGAASTTNGIILPNFSVYGGRLIVVAKQVGASNAAVWRVDVSALRGNGVGTVVMIDGTSAAIAPTASTGTVTGWSLTVGADTTNGGIAVSGTGVAATTINWFARFMSAEVATAS